MASQTKTLPADGRAPETRWVSQLAEQPALTQALRWFQRERVWINDQHLQVCRIPAPTFFEQQRAEWLRERLNSFGWDARIDRAGNVAAQFDRSGSTPLLLVSAHLDTVLAPAQPEDISVAADGSLVGPGSSDNGAGLAALLALARLLAESPGLSELRSSLLLVANVGEEGEGNLSGMRYLCRQYPQLSKVAAFIVLDGPSTDHITAQALASRRFEVSFNGPGGHSWNDYGSPNPVHAIGEVISHFIQSAEERLGSDRFTTDTAGSDRPTRCSFNFGIVEGGTSVNSIPAMARAKLDLRSEDTNLLDEVAALLTAAVERALERENRRARGERLTAKIKELGSRPGGKLPESSPLLRAVQAVDAHLNIRARIDCASTDANVPLSMNLPAISIGAGGQGGGAHSSHEWYQPETRELGLRRILLILAALADRNRPR